MYDNRIAQCEYFTVDKLDVTEIYNGKITTNSFVSILVLDGSGGISIEDETLTFKKGDCFFIPAQNSDYKITGTVEALLTFLG